LGKVVVITLLAFCHSKDLKITIFKFAKSRKKNREMSRRIRRKDEQEDEQEYEHEDQ
jgi:hypothetical protein